MLQRYSLQNLPAGGRLAGCVAVQQEGVHQAGEDCGDLTLAGHNWYGEKVQAVRRECCDRTECCKHTQGSPPRHQHG